MTSHAKVLTAVVLLLALGAFAPAAEATNIPNGAWQLIANNSFGTLQINSIDGSGTMNLTAFGNPTVGFYNNVANTIVFTRQAGSLVSSQTYTGALMVLDAGGGVCTYVLTGTFIAYTGAGASASRSTFAWAAFINGPCPV